MSIADLAMCGIPYIHHFILLLCQLCKIDIISHMLQMKKLRFRNIKCSKITKLEIINSQFKTRSDKSQYLYSLKDLSLNFYGFEV